MLFSSACNRQRRASCAGTAPSKQLSQQTGSSHLARAGRARCEAADGFPSGAALLDDLYARLDGARGDTARAPLLQELLAAAFAPFAAHLRAWLYGAGPPRGAFGAAPDACAASFFPADTPVSARVLRPTASRVQGGRGLPAWRPHVARRPALFQAQRS